MNSSSPAAVREECPKPRRLADVFVCGFRTKRMYLATCLDDYMNANALRVRSMVCHECPQGADNRLTFADLGDPE